MADDLEQRIRERAYRIWLDEGRPEGRAAAHWAKARDLVSSEANQKDATKPNPTKSVDRTFQDRPVEPREAVESQGEFPAPTGQGEEQGSPKRPRRKRRRS